MPPWSVKKATPETSCAALKHTFLNRGCEVSTYATPLFGNNFLFNESSKQFYQAVEKFQRRKRRWFQHWKMLVLVVRRQILTLDFFQAPQTKCTKQLPPWQKSSSSNRLLRAPKTTCCAEVAKKLPAQLLQKCVFDTSGRTVCFSMVWGRHGQDLAPCLKKNYWVLKSHLFHWRSLFWH